MKDQPRRREGAKHAAKCRSRITSTRAICVICGLSCLLHAPRAIAQSTYRADFQNAEVGSLPEGIKTLRGDFAVAEVGANRFLELFPWPINGFGVLVGPQRSAEASIRARVRSWTTGRRFPEFGIGLGGIGGYRLWLMPAVGELQIKRAEEVLASTPFNWKGGEWTQMHLQIRQAEEGKWLITGKAWMEGDPEPADWTIRTDITTEPPAGECSLWATPYSEKPIQFDDVLAQGG